MPFLHRAGQFDEPVRRKEGKHLVQDSRAALTNCLDRRLHTLPELVGSLRELRHLDQFVPRSEQRRVRAGPWIARSISYELELARPKTPPSRSPAARSVPVATPAAEALNSDMDPLPHRSQKNSNW